MTRSPCHFLQLHWKTPKKIVYLTADTDTALETLAADEIYVIGGILDHNLLKGCTKEFADSARLRTARLPITEHMVTTAGRKVLTVNQVYSALLGCFGIGVVGEKPCSLLYRNEKASNS